MMIMMMMMGRRRKFKGSSLDNLSVADDSRAPPLLTRRRKCGRLLRLCRASWQEARVAVAVGAFVSPLSEHVSPEQPGAAPLADGPALNCNQWHVPGDGPALNCNQDMFRLQLRCSGGTSNLGVDARTPWAAQLFPPREWFSRLVLSALFWPSYGVGSLLWGR